MRPRWFRICLVLALIIPAPADLTLSNAARATPQKLFPSPAAFALEAVLQPSRFDHIPIEPSLDLFRRTNLHAYLASLRITRREFFETLTVASVATALIYAVKSLFSPAVMAHAQNASPSAEREAARVLIEIFDGNPESGSAIDNLARFMSSVHDPQVERDVLDWLILKWSTEQYLAQTTGRTVTAKGQALQKMIDASLGRPSGPDRLLEIIDVTRQDDVEAAVWWQYERLVQQANQDGKGWAFSEKAVQQLIDALQNSTFQTAARILSLGKASPTLWEKGVDRAGRLAEIRGDSAALRNLSMFVQASKAPGIPITTDPATWNIEHSALGTEAAVNAATVHTLAERWLGQDPSDSQAAADQLDHLDPRVRNAAILYAGRFAGDRKLEIPDRCFGSMMAAALESRVDYPAIGVIVAATDEPFYKEIPYTDTEVRNLANFIKRKNALVPNGLAAPTQAEAHAVRILPKPPIVPNPGFDERRPNVSAVSVEIQPYQTSITVPIRLTIPATRAAALLVDKTAKYISILKFQLRLPEGASIASVSAGPAAQNGQKSPLNNDDTVVLYGMNFGHLEDGIIADVTIHGLEPSPEPYTLSVEIPQGSIQASSPSGRALDVGSGSSVSSANPTEIGGTEAQKVAAARVVAAVLAQQVESEIRKGGPRPARIGRGLLGSLRVRDLLPYISSRELDPSVRRRASDMLQEALAKVSRGFASTARDIVREAIAGALNACDVWQPLGVVDQTDVRAVINAILGLPNAANIPDAEKTVSFLQHVVNAALGLGCITGNQVHFIEVSWTPSVSAGVDGYQVLMGTIQGGAKLVVNSDKLITGNGYVIYNVVGGQKYFLVAVTVGDKAYFPDDAQGNPRNISPYSEEISATIPTTFASVSPHENGHINHRLAAVAA